MNAYVPKTEKEFAVLMRPSVTCFPKTKLNYRAALKIRKDPCDFSKFLGGKTGGPRGGIRKDARQDRSSGFYKGGRFYTPSQKNEMGWFPANDLD